MKNYNVWANFEERLKSLRGAFTPEQFGVFLNMDESEVIKNYLVLFHENYHHWQSVLTPYGCSKWMFTRSTSSETIQQWLNATSLTPHSRTIPISHLIPTESREQLGYVAKCYSQTFAEQVIRLAERAQSNTELESIIKIPISRLSPIIQVQGINYSLNGIDIIEGLAKYQEAVLAFVVENKSMDEIIDPSVLKPEYYIALFYFIEHVGIERVFEFPAVCEMALLSTPICAIDQEEWKSNYPAWRFIKIVDTISSYNSPEFLGNEIDKNYVPYCEKTLSICGFEGFMDSFLKTESLLSTDSMNLPKEMLNAIRFKIKHPHVLAFPLFDFDLFVQLKKYHPYFYITSNSSQFAVESDSTFSEILLENHYRSFANQICGCISQRCIDTTKLQCGFSYYGIKSCKYLESGVCDGHIDQNTILPQIQLDETENVMEGCLFEVFLKLMGIDLQDLHVKEMTKKIDSQALLENALKFKTK